MSMVCVEIVELMAPLSVSSKGASARTVTDSEVLPTSIVASTRMVCAACTSKPGRTIFLETLHCDVEHISACG